MRSVLAAVGLVCLAVSVAAAQSNTYWLTFSLPGFLRRHKAKPPLEIPDVPFAPAHNVPLSGIVKIPPGLKLIGSVAPLWLGPDAVALPVMRNDSLALIAWQGDHFGSVRVVADSATVHGANILDMAVNRDGSSVAIAAAVSDGLQIWVRNTNGDAPASVVAKIGVVSEKAGISWLNANTLAVGLQVQALSPESNESSITAPDQEQAPAPPEEPERSIYIVRPGQQQPISTLDVACVGHIDPTNLLWSPDGNFAIAHSQKPGAWTLIDRPQTSCEAISLPAIIPEQFLVWDNESRRFLFTAAPQRSPDPAHIGVMEYAVDSHKARLLASPAAAAAYADGTIVVLGSQRLNAAALLVNRDVLFPAEIALIDPKQSQLQIVPTGLNTTAAALLHGYVSASELGVLAISFRVPALKYPFSALLWMSVHAGGVLATGRIGTMVGRWSPDGSRVAVLAGLPDDPTLAIVALPH
jgi:hypothetical protein